MKTKAAFIPVIGATFTILFLQTAYPPNASAQEQTPLPHVNPAEFVFIAGQVNVPQRYVYTNGLTLGAAIKMSKGVTTEASSTKVTLTRAGEKTVTLDRRAIDEGKAKDILLQPGDKIFVPKK